MIAEGMCCFLLSILGHAQSPRMSPQPPPPPHGGGMGGPPPFGGGGPGGGGIHLPGGISIGGRPPRDDQRGGGPPPIADRIHNLRRRLQDLGTPTDPQTRLLQSLAQTYLDRSDSARRNRDQFFLADRLVTSADSLIRAATLLHQAPSEETAAPTTQDLNDRLDRLYFRLQQADYFYEQSGDASAKPLPDLARTLYRQALQSTDDSPAVALQTSRAASEVVNALESLAHSALPGRKRRPPPPPMHEDE